MRSRHLLHCDIPMTANAATSSGPLSVSDIPAHREFFDADGDLVVPDEASALARSLGPIVSKLDAVLRRAMCARIIAKRHDVVVLVTLRG
jgi:hypothetical protein